jgi:thiosulfate/3-mercaptopyruvate sulfurtransferase
VRGRAHTVRKAPREARARRSLHTLAARRNPLVQTAWLRANADDARVTVVDCRFVLGNPGAGRQAYDEGHIPGAAFLDVDTDLAAEPGGRGRHPLPDAKKFEAAARRAGIGRDTFVVAYDESGEGGAARLWWLLRHFGHDDAAVLDGGLAAWREEGGPLRPGPERVEEGDFVARPREGDTVSAEDIAEAAGGRPGDVEAASGRAPGAAGGRAPDAGFRLLDARAPERFRGEVEPIDPLAGHIPGAVNVPFAEVAPRGRFLPAEELRERLGDEPFVAYCGSGVTACTLVLAGELAGVEGRLYPGSWSEWCRRA